MGLPRALEGLRKHPDMRLGSVHFDAAVACVAGYSAATEGGFLTGFREWLVVRADGGNNLAWPTLVEDLMSSAAVERAESGAEEGKIEFMFSLLDEFLQERDRYDGIRQIFAAYENWLRRRTWYQEGT